MTSKISFYKMMKEDVRRRIWVPVLALFAFFIITLLPYLWLQSERGYNRDLAFTFVQFWSHNNLALEFAVPVGALIAAFSGFSWLFSKKKLDLYHSLPVKREKMFWVFYLDGILMYLIPELVILAVGMLAAGFMMELSLPVAAVVLADVLNNLVFFLLFYSVAVAVIMMTGTIFAGILGTGVLLAYGPALIGVAESYCGFFETRLVEESLMTRGGTYTSPVTWMADYFMGIDLPPIYLGDRAIPQGLCRPELAVLVLICLLITGASLFLYRKRASERSGESVVFGPVKTVVKWMVVVLFALAVGFVFMAMSSDQTFWLFFGIVFGAVVSHGVIEIIYQMDFKAIWSHKLCMAGCIAVSVLIACVFRFDWFGYDSWLPKQSRVESMGVEIAGFNPNMNYYYETGEYDEFYLLKEMKLSGENSSSFGGAAWDLASAGAAAPSREDTEEENLYQVKIRYGLSGGKNVYREYWLDENTVFGAADALYQDEAYKKALYPILNKESSQYDSVWYMYRGRTEGVMEELPEEEVEEILQAYQQDLSEASFEELRAGEVKAILWFERSDEELEKFLGAPETVQMEFYDTKRLDEEKRDDYMQPYYVYDSFDRTLSALQQAGAVYAQEEPVLPENIVELKLWLPYGDMVEVSGQDMEEYLPLLGEMPVISFSQRREEEACLVTVVYLENGQETQRDYWIDGALLP